MKKRGQIGKPFTGNERSYRIPSLHRREALSPTSGVTPARDIVQRHRALRVQQRIDEPERGLPRVEQRVVEQRNNARKGRRGRARALEQAEHAVDSSDEVDGLGGDVGESAAGTVKEACVRAAKGVEVIFDCAALVVRTSEDVREAAAREGRCDFGSEALGSADRRQAVVPKVRNGGRRPKK